MNKLIATINGLDVFCDNGIPPQLSIFSAEDSSWYADIVFPDTRPALVLMRNIAFGQPVAVVREFAAALTLAAEIADAGPTWKPDPAPAAVTATENAIERDIAVRRGKITPGPWHACKQGECICGSVYGADENTMVATAPTFDEADQIPNEEHIKANARFIAHAPADIAYLLRQLALIRTALDSALAAAKEGRWTSVKTTLEAAHHDQL